jgi:hypothetical protein
MVLLKLYIAHKIINNEKIDNKLLKIIKDDVENAYRSEQLFTDLQCFEKRIS